MKRIVMLGLLAMPFLVLANVPQEAPPAGFLVWSSDALAQKAKELSVKAAKDVNNHAATEQEGDFQNDLYMLAHREANGQAELHETQADLFVVQSGTATLIVGGTMPDSKTVSPHEQRAAAVQGGIRQKLSAGDIVRIPAKTPHQLILDGSREFTYFVVKIKGY